MAVENNKNYMAETVSKHRKMHSLSNIAAVVGSKAQACHTLTAS
jgi:hypothetical protein